MATFRARRLRLVEDRIERYASEREPDLVLDPAAVEEADELLRAVGWDIETGGAQLDVEAVLAVAWLYWFRATAATAVTATPLRTAPFVTAEAAARSDADLAVAILLFTPLLQVRPDLVPGELRETFEAVEAAAVAASAPTEVAWALEVVGASRIRADGEPVDTAVGGVVLPHRREPARLPVEGSPAIAEPEEAVSLLRETVAAAESDGPHRDGTLGDLDRALRSHHHAMGSTSPAWSAAPASSVPVAPLDEAVAAGREAVAAAGDSGELPVAAWRLALALHARYEVTGHLPDLDEAVMAAATAVEVTAPGHPRHAAYLDHQATVLRARFTRTAVEADLDAAVAAGRGAAEAAPDPVHLSTLAAALTLRYERAGDLADLEQAVSAGRAALAATAATDPALPRRQAALAVALRARYDHLGSEADLDRALELARAAVAAVVEVPADRAAAHAALSGALLSSHQLRSRPADLDEAVRAARASVDDTPLDAPELAGRWNHLGVVLLRRARHPLPSDPPDDPDLDPPADPLADPSADPPADPSAVPSAGSDGGPRDPHDDLHDAVAAMIAAVEHSGPDSPGHATLCSTLSVALLAAYQGMGAVADLEEAAVWAREAVDLTTDEQPDRALHLVNLARALAGSPATLDEALACLHTACTAAAAPPLLQLYAARWLGHAAADAGYAHDAEHGFATAVGLLGAASCHSLVPGSQEADLATAAATPGTPAAATADVMAAATADSPACDAAAWSIHNGNPVRAVELLEAGRRCATDEWDALAAAAPDLARRIAEVGAALNRIPPGHVVTPP